MTEPDRTSSDPDEPRPTPDLARDLNLIYSQKVEVPAAVDRAILDQARAHLANTRETANPGLRPHWRRIAPWAAVAALVALAAALPVFVPLIRSSPSGLSPVFALEDVDHNGRVDIRDALAVARDKAAGRAVSLDPTTIARHAVAVPDISPAQPPIEGPTRFVTVDVFVDPKGRPLAAYQVRFSAGGAGARVRVVGVENGQSPAYPDPAYYDVKAADAGSDHLTLASFSTAPAGDLPRAKVRVATLHLAVTGQAAPRLSITLDTAADPTGQSIDATATLSDISEGTQP